jgi:hypothetical protein
VRVGRGARAARSGQRGHAPTSPVLMSAWTDLEATGSSYDSSRQKACSCVLVDAVGNLVTGEWTPPSRTVSLQSRRTCARSPSASRYSTSAAMTSLPLRCSATPRWSKVPALTTPDRQTAQVIRPPAKHDRGEGPLTVVGDAKRTLWTVSDESRSDGRQLFPQLPRRRSSR